MPKKICTKTWKFFLQFMQLHLHWFDCELQSSRRFVMVSSNFLACGPGFKTLTSPHWEQGSIQILLRPVHHAPGATRLRPRLRIFSSKYIRRVRGRLSHPNTQNSRKDRLKTNHWEPAIPKKYSYLSVTFHKSTAYHKCDFEQHKLHTIENRLCLWILWKRQVLAASQ